MKKHLGIFYIYFIERNIKTADFIVYHRKNPILPPKGLILIPVCR